MTNTPQQACEVTVTVSGERGSGKSYLIAVLAQALRGAGHEAITPHNTPSAIQAISDLSRPYSVVFLESKPDEKAQAVQAIDGAISEIESLRAQVIKLEAERTALKAALGREHGRLFELEQRNAYLEQQVRANVTNGLSPDEINRLINRALTHARDGAKIEEARLEVLRRAESLKTDANKMRDEAEARQREAKAMLYQVFTGHRPAPLTPAQIQMERRNAARTLSASDKLALANGADLDLLDAAQSGPEASLASAIEHALGGESAQ